MEAMETSVGVADDFTEQVEASMEVWKLPPTSTKKENTVQYRTIGVVKVPRSTMELLWKHSENAVEVPWKSHGILMQAQ